MLSPTPRTTFTRLSENEFITDDIPGNMFDEWNLAALPGENFILRLQCGT
jgi:hypothetical protein